MTIINPKINIQIEGAPVPTQIAERRVLLIGQKTASGSAPTDILVQNLGNNNEQDALFGNDSMLTAMVRGFKEYNKYTPLDAIPLDDNGTAVDATGTIAITGTSATEDKTIYVTIGSRKNHYYEIDITATDDPTAVGDAIAAAVNGDARAPVTAANVTGAVTFTAVNGGTVGNFITIRIDGVPVAGLTFSIIPMQSGATDPILTGILTQIANIRYTDIVVPGSYTLTSFIDLQENRWNPSGYRILDGITIFCQTDTVANFVSSTEATNKKTVSYLANKKVDLTYHKGSAIIELDHVVSSKFSAIDSIRLTTGAVISNFVVATEGANDNIGGIHISTLPFHNTPFPDLYVTEASKFFTNDEIDQLTGLGFVIFGNNIANTAVILNSVVTRYKTNAAAEADESFKYLNYVEQASVVREYFYNGLINRFNQSRLTQGERVPGFNMANSTIIKAECGKLYQELAELAVVPAGDAALKLFRDNLIVTIDYEDGLVTITMLDPVVTQIRQINTVMQLVFNL